MTKKLIPPVLAALVLCGGCTATVAGQALPDPAAITTTAPVTANDTVPPSTSTAPTTAPADSPYVYGGVDETQGGTGLTPNDGPNDFGGVR